MRCNTEMLWGIESKFVLQLTVRWLRLGIDSVARHRQ